MKIGERVYSPLYQRVVFVAAHGKFTDSNRHWLMDTSGIAYFAESFVPFHG